MKKSRLPAYLFILAWLFVVALPGLLQLIRIQTITEIPTPMPPHQIERLSGLRLIWQVSNTFVPFRVNGPYMQVSGGKVYFKGSLNNEPRFKIIGLDEKDGSVLIQTDLSRDAGEFFVNETALYVGMNNPARIVKYALPGLQPVWTQEVGNVKAGCCFSLVNGELQSSWYPFHYFIQSVQNGEILKEVEDRGDYIYRLEGNIAYRRGGALGLFAEREDGSAVWDVKTKEFSRAPIFTEDRIYLLTGSSGMGSIYAIDRRSGAIYWKTENHIISGNIAVSANRVYCITYEGNIEGLNASNGSVETSATISPNDLYPISTKRSGYEIAYDGDTHRVFVILGNSAQMLAFEEY